ncbi:MAG: type II secretion system F family protein [Burkholderiaceae bacterium]|nr:type II secretion system F family protein [Burkholderiaceae bacterium]
MIMPGLTLIVGLFTRLLPQLFAGSITPAYYLWHSVQPLLVVALLVYLGRLVYRMQEGRASPLREAVDNVLTGIPLIGDVQLRRNMRDFFESLGLLVEAGMPILDALPRATATMRLTSVRRQFETIAPGIKSGATLAEMLEAIPLLRGSSGKALIKTGEVSGSLPEMLFRFADMETAAIAHFDQQLADWLPRIVYAIVAVWMAWGLISGPGIMPQLPSDLQ